MTDSTVVKFPLRSRTKSPSGKPESTDSAQGPGWVNSIPEKTEEVRDLLVDLVESISDGFALYDPNNRMVLWNEKYATIISYARNLMTPGVPFETLLRKCAEEHFAGQSNSVQEMEAWIQEAILFHRAQATYERPTNDGKCYLVSRRRSQNQHTAVVWTDITERKRAEVALQQSEKLYRDLFEGSHQGLAVECEWQIIRTNSAFVKIFGLASKDDIKTHKDFDALFAPQDRKRIRRLHRDQLARKGGSTEFEFQAKRGDGKHIWVHATAVCIEWDGKPTLQITYADETEKKEFQEQLLAKKLETVGVMAHGIAMEFTKVNSAIMSAVRMAKMESYASGLSKVSEMLSEAEQIGEHSSELTQELLFLHRGGSPVKERARIEELLKSAIQFPSYETKVIPIRKPDVRIKLDFGRRLWAVEVDKGQITGVLRSLVGNGLDSMPFGGTLIIEAENLRLDHKAKGVPLPLGNYIKVTIADEGSGMSLEMLDRVFDPYFTSFQKAGDLRLTSAYAIAKHHGGVITASSRHGKGTRMTLFLPAITEQVPRKIAGQFDQ